MFKKINIKFLEIFFKSPLKRFNVREVARLTNVSPATASKRLKRLRKMGVLKMRKEKVFKFYRANLEDDNYRDLKLYYNIRKIKESGLLEALNQFYLKPTMILFGSAAKGRDTETSDFDIMVISEKTEKMVNIEEFEKRTHRRIQLLVVKNIEDIKNEYLINNIINGITIQGRVEWI